VGGQGASRPAGYLSRKEAEAVVQALLTESLARCGGVLQALGSQDSCEPRCLGDAEAPITAALAKSASRWLIGHPRGASTPAG
jgi:hypothetical protein